MVIIILPRWMNLTGFYRQVYLIPFIKNEATDDFKPITQLLCITSKNVKIFLILHTNIIYSLISEAVVVKLLCSFSGYKYAASVHKVILVIA